MRFFFCRIFGLAITSYKIGWSDVKTLQERISFSIKLQKASPGGAEAIAGTFPLGASCPGEVPPAPCPLVVGWIPWKYLPSGCWAGATGFLRTGPPGSPQTAVSAQKSVSNGFALCKQAFLSGCQNIASQLLITWARTELVIYTGRALCLLP